MIQLYLPSDSRLQAQRLGKVLSQRNQIGNQAKHAERLRLILGRLNVSMHPRDMALPGLNLHELTGARKGTWVVKVSGNWRVTFRFEGEDITAVDYEDYH